ncbi:hypothetical protein KM043_014063 [Ampulex compressa]|nr:hypothetical protein KM043_014063 [Ampulex compressa]
MYIVLLRPPPHRPFRRPPPCAERAGSASDGNSRHEDENVKRARVENRRALPGTITRTPGDFGPRGGTGTLDDFITGILLQLNGRYGDACECLWYSRGYAPLPPGVVASTRQMEEERSRKENDGEERIPP